MICKSYKDRGKSIFAPNGASRLDMILYFVSKA